MARAPHGALAPGAVSTLEFAERWSELARARCVHVRGALAPAECAAMVERVMAAEADWTHDFGGDQFSLGLAWYTHLESGRTRHYFRDAARANALVERVLPGMQAAVRAAIGSFVAAPTEPRPGFCGAGVHVFQPGSPVARGGGSVHYDLEGLRSEDERRGAALSFVMMLQPAEVGGGLRLWQARYRGALQPSRAEAARAHHTQDYAAGDVLLFESQRLHQIAPFSGARARVSITAHALRTPAGPWHVWF